MEGHAEHRCNIKEKLAELAEEIKLWEDEVHRSPVTSHFDSKPVFKKQESNAHCRESLANLDIVPVSKMKARFECLSGESRKENIKPPNMQHSPLVNSISKATSYFSPIIKHKVEPTKVSTTERPTVIDVPRGSISQAERSRLERMNELDNLRQRHAGIKSRETAVVHTSLPTPPVPVSELIQDDVKRSCTPQCDVPTESDDDAHSEADYTLPPPPTTPSGDVVDGSHAPVSPPPMLDSMDICLKINNSGIETGPPGDADVLATKIDTESEIQNTSDEAILHSEREEYYSANDSASSNDGFIKHEYYARPTFGAKRRYEDAGDTAAAAGVLPRQRSVTFVAPHGAAPGDTTSEGTAFDLESEMESSDADSRTSRPLRVDSCQSAGSLYSYCGEHSAKVYEGSESGGDLTSITSSEAASDVGSRQSHAATGLQPNRRRSNSNASDVQRRRRERLDELPILLDAERSMILQASNALQQCASCTSSGSSVSGGNKAGSSFAFSAVTPKRSRLHLSSQQLSSSGVESQLGPGSQAHVEASRTLLIACQRRQVLMEELVLLQGGSPLLVPPSRGEPIRARLRLTGVRLGLKVPRKPGGAAASDSNADTTGGGGFVVVDQKTVASLNDRHGLSGAPLRYHLIAIIKCRGEGRMFHSDMVTLMHVNDLPVGTVRPADYVDLSASIEIVPLRPDFVFTLEVYCLTVGSDSAVRSLRSCVSPQLPQLLLSDSSSGGHKRTPRPKPRSRGWPARSPTLDWQSSGGCRMPPPIGTPLTRSSKKVLQQLTDLARPQHQHRRRGPDTPSSALKPPSSHLLTTCLLAANVSPGASVSVSPSGPSNNYFGGGSVLSGSMSPGNKMAAFTLLSSADMRYHDDLLIGRLHVSPSRSRPPPPPTGERVPTILDSQMPLRLTRLPRSSPLSGFAGLVRSSVGLEARVMNRGFITVFEEVSGLGIWRRYWCQLRADHLHFWRYPEEEEHRSPSRWRTTASLHVKQRPPSVPLGRIDLRHVTAPWAVPAPHHICARTNTIYMRSIRSVEPGCLSASVNPVAISSSSEEQSGGAAAGGSSSGESLIFRANSELSWLEQKHLLCADTLEERDRWIHALNTSLESLKQWMPAHFTALSKLDDELQFPQPVSSSLAALLIRGEGLGDQLMTGQSVVR